MLMQSSDEAIHLLPALPDALKEYGEIAGLKARGGFEIKEMKWKNGKLVAVSIQSNLGGNLRLRTPNQIIPKNKMDFKTASGGNSNVFYETDAIKKPIIAKESTIRPLNIQPTFLYDVATEKGKIYHFSIKE
ncbi:glycoside hydrolase family 95-like protein [Flavobacterium sp. P21]|uniref:glycoside hydrolase family 95-like protein n=1 Tax=Flavobacterium sp. P21 TaxID=3423948 RepID=UPI003D67809E